MFSDDLEEISSASGVKAIVCTVCFSDDTFFVFCLYLRGGSDDEQDQLERR